MSPKHAGGDSASKSASARQTVPKQPSKHSHEGSSGARSRSKQRPKPSRAVLVLNGPNLAALGSRQPEVYGSADYDALRTFVAAEAEALGLEADVRQTDDESQMIAWVYEAIDGHHPVIMNPAAFTHYSYSLADAAVQITAAGLPLIELHISNPHAREGFRRHSVITPVASGVIAGFGFDSYALALAAVDRLLR